MTAAVQDARETGLASPLPDERPGITAGCVNRQKSRYGHLRAECGRVKDGPGGAGNTNRSLTRTDRLRRSEGCREGYPDHPHPGTWNLRMSRNGARRSCPSDHRDELLKKQGFVCIYCAEPFGSVVRHRRGLTVTSVHYDHAVPLAYLNANPRWNWVAACNVCNLIKGSNLIPSIAEIRMFVLERRERRGYEIQWRAPVSSESDPDRWAVVFATYLSTLSYWEAETVKTSPVMRHKHFRTALGTALSALERVSSNSDDDWISQPNDRALNEGAGPKVAWASNRKGPWPWSK